MVEINNVISEGQSLTFDIKGNQETGLSKSVINAIRRTLLSSIPTVAFRTLIDDSDIRILENTTPLHNEFMLHRISLIPLYLDPDTYENQYLFYLDVEGSDSSPVTTITAKDFQVYPLKDSVNGKDIEELNLANYDRQNPLSEEEKAKIFRPFQYNGKDSYCIVTELRNTSSKQKQKLRLYGVPSVSYAYEDARWQSVSRATYQFKIDEDLFQSILQEKIKISNIQNVEEYSNSLRISEAERYFYRDTSMEPYWYTMTIDSVHQKTPKELFLKACEIIIEQCGILKEEFKSLSSGKETILQLTNPSEAIFHIVCHGYDDTMGNLIQNHISDMIDENTTIQSCGYKRVHPLEEKIKWVVGMNPGHPISGQSTPQKISEIVKVFHTSLDKLVEQFQGIIQEATTSL